MAKHLIKANVITSEADKISVIRKLQYTQVWGFDPLDLVTKQYVDEAISGVTGFIQNQDAVAQNAKFRITGQGEASAFRTGSQFINEDRLSMTHMSWSSGVYSYAGLTITSPTTFDIGAFNGYVVDNTVTNNPDLIEVNYPGSTGNTTPFLGTGPATFIMANSAGTIILTNVVPTEPIQRSHIILGALAHPAGQLTSLTNKTDVIIQPMDQVRDMFRPIKYINDGVQCMPNGVNLALANSSGRLYGLGIGFVTNGKNQPSSLDIPAGAPTVFQYRTQTGGAGANTSLIVPGSYDVAGTVTPVGGGASASTNQRVYLSETGLIRVQYGQTVYATLNEAITASNTEPFVVFSNNRLFGILIAIISVVKTATNLADPTQARILSVSKFGEAVGGAAGIATGNLQNAYNNSANPEIVTNALNSAFTIRRGSAGDADNIFEGQNGAGTVTSRIDGNGFLTVQDFLSTFNVRANNSVRADVSFLVGTGAGTNGGNDNLIKPFAASANLNLKGGSGRAKICISDDAIDIISGNNISLGIIFKGNVSTSTGTGAPFGQIFATTGNWVLQTGGSLVDNGFKLEVVGTSRFAGITTIGTPTNAFNFNINGPIGSDRIIYFLSANTNRWAVYSSSGAESGSNEGSNFTIARFNDAGALLENPFFIKRATGFIGIGATITSPLSRLQVDGRITITNPPSTEAIRVVNDSGYISFFDTANSTRTGFIQGAASNSITIACEAGNKYILLNSGGGNVGVNTISPQAKLQVGSDHTPGTGEASFKGYIQINHNPNVSADGGLEFKLDASSNGYGKRILGVFNGASDYNLEFQSRTATANWSTNFAINSGANQSRVISFKNPGALANNYYTNSHFEARTDDGSAPAYSFHRAGFDAIALYHLDGSATGLLRIREAGGGDYTVWHSGNFSPVAGSGTLDQVLTNGNISNPPNRYMIVGNVTVGKSGSGYGTIGDGYITTGTPLTYNYARNDFATAIEFHNGNFFFQTAPTGTTGNPITFNTRLFVANGPETLVGIGTTTTGFGIGGRTVLSIDGPTNSLMEFKAGGGFCGYLFGNSGNLEIASANTLFFVSGGALNMRLTPAGELAVGGNFVPSAKLHVLGSGPLGVGIIAQGASEALRMIGDNTFISWFNNGNTIRTGFIQGSASGSINIQSEVGNQYLFLNPAGGNVGIGTFSPAFKLDVAGNFSCKSDVGDPSGAVGGITMTASGSSSTFRIGMEASASWIQSYNSTPLYINKLGNNVYLNVNGGNVGIGNVGPSEKLEVTGNVKATEFIRTSSIANKTNVEDYTDSALSILLDTKIRTYEKIDTGEFGIGFIAEDTHEILSGKKHDVHNFGAHLALLTKAIQELKEENEQLKNRIKNLE